MSIDTVDPMRAKHLSRALTQLAEEGVARAFRTRLGSNWIVGVLGALQFEVMADRIRTEYDIIVKFTPIQLYTARWLESDNPQSIKKFSDKNPSAIADDHDGTPVFLARNEWHLDNAIKDSPNIRFLKTLESTPENFDN
jgi:peptide chain release factor 3